MNITFGTAKDADNISKHGLSLIKANDLEWATLITKTDARRNYGEVRTIGYALMGTRLFCVVFTDRDSDRRIISLRKANQREVSNYVVKN